MLPFAGRSVVAAGGMYGREGVGNARLVSVPPQPHLPQYEVIGQFQQQQQQQVQQMQQQYQPMPPQHLAGQAMPCSSTRPVEVSPVQQQRNLVMMRSHNGGGFHADALQVQEKFSKQQQFRMELDEQLRLKEERKQRERMEKEQRDAREHHEMSIYNPFGKGGAGAPLRDSDGLVVADLRNPADPAVTQQPSSTDHGYGSPPVRQQKTFPSPPPQVGVRALNLATEKLAQAREQGNGAPPTDSARFSRFQFDRAPPEERERIQDKVRKQQEAQRLLREQLEDNRRRKAQEKRDREAEERKEEERLEREREELRKAYEREKGRISKNQSKASIEQAQASADVVGSKGRSSSNNNNNEDDKNIRDLEDKREQPSIMGSPTREPLMASPARDAHYSQMAPSPSRSAFGGPASDAPWQAPAYSSPLRARFQVTQHSQQHPQQYAPGESATSMSAQLQIPARISVLREELLGEHDSLRRQIRRQEDMLRHLRSEVTGLKRENEKLSRKRHLGRYVDQASRMSDVPRDNHSSERSALRADGFGGSPRLNAKSSFIPSIASTSAVDALLNPAIFPSVPAAQPSESITSSPAHVPFAGDESTDELDRFLHHFVAQNGYRR